jgi:hypothetical protein
MKPAFALVALTALGACQIGAATPDSPDACGASGLQGLIGGPVPATIAAPGPVRIYAQGDPVTMDYSERRLNVVLDAATRSRIVAITCG